MGTNYYYQEASKCPTCGHLPEPLHIGKSSGGWCFALHVYPEQGINDLADWTRKFEEACEIHDEYGVCLTPYEMLRAITVRGHVGPMGDPGPRYENWADFHAKNHSEPGPNGLLRHKLSEGHCIGHGAGTWDLLVSDFS